MQPEKNFSFPNFLGSIEELDFAEAFRKTSVEIQSIKPLANRELRKQTTLQNYNVIKYEKQLNGLAFWFHTCTKPADLSDTEFQLIKPLCIKLIEKGNFKATAISAFEN